MSGVGLLPCPFCGGVGDIESQPSYSQAANTYERYRGWCDGCGFGLDWHNYEADAIAAWNTRTPAQPLDAATIERCARAMCVKDGMDPDEHVIGGQASGFQDYGPLWQAERVSEGQLGVADYAGLAEASLRALNTASTTTRGEDARLRGQDEGFAAAVQWLRERSAMKPAAPLATEASALADWMERSRIPCAALQGEAAHTSQEKGE